MMSSSRFPFPRLKLTGIANPATFRARHERRTIRLRTAEGIQELNMPMKNTDVTAEKRDQPVVYVSTTFLDLVGRNDSKCPKCVTMDSVETECT